MIRGRPGLATGRPGTCADTDTVWGRRWNATVSNADYIIAGGCTATGGGVNISLAVSTAGPQRVVTKPHRLVRDPGTAEKAVDLSVIDLK